MVKSWTYSYLGVALFLILPLASLAQKKRVPLKKINISSLILESDCTSVYPGMLLPLKVKVIGTKGRFFYSEGFSRGEVSNKQFKFSSSQGASRINGVRLAPDPYQYLTDSVQCKVDAKSKKDLSTYLSLPIFFNCRQKVDYSGAYGVDGAHGSDGAAGMMGSAPDYSSAGGGGGGRTGGNGSKGSLGQIGYNGTAGKDLIIDVQLVNFRAKDYVELKIYNVERELLSTHLLNGPNGTLVIDCKGGEGGNGGNGGYGGDRGEDMGAGTGVPGLGADGGDGGHGGNGGNILLRLNGKSKVYQNRIICITRGGSGGDGGNGGEAGNPKRAVLGSQHALKGIDGDDGQNGTVKIEIRN